MTQPRISPISFKQDERRFWHEDLPITLADDLLSALALQHFRIQWNTVFSVACYLWFHHPGILQRLTDGQAPRLWHLGFDRFTCHNRTSTCYGDVRGRACEHP